MYHWPVAAFVPIPEHKSIWFVEVNRDDKVWIADSHLVDEVGQQWKRTWLRPEGRLDNDRRDLVDRPDLFAVHLHGVEVFFQSGKRDVLHGIRGMRLDVGINVWFVNQIVTDDIWLLTELSRYHSNNRIITSHLFALVKPNVAYKNSHCHVNNLRRAARLNKKHSQLLYIPNILFLNVDERWIKINPGYGSFKTMVNNQ